MGCHILLYDLSVHSTLSCDTYMMMKMLLANMVNGVMSYAWCACCCRTFSPAYPHFAAIFVEVCSLLFFGLMPDRATAI